MISELMNKNETQFRAYSAITSKSTNTAMVCATHVNSYEHGWVFLYCSVCAFTCDFEQILYVRTCVCDRRSCACMSEFALLYMHTIARMIVRHAFDYIHSSVHELSYVR